MVNGLYLYSAFLVSRPLKALKHYTPEARWPRDDVSGLAVGLLSQQQISYWAVHASDLWVASTPTQGYKLQFQCWPPASNQVRVINITDLARSLTLNQELAVLLAKGAIERVDPRSQSRDFYSTYFLVKTAGYVQS